MLTLLGTILACSLGPKISSSLLQEQSEDKCHLIDTHTQAYIVSDLETQS